MYFFRFFLKRAVERQRLAVCVRMIRQAPSGLRTLQLRFGDGNRDYVIGDTVLAQGLGQNLDL